MSKKKSILIATLSRCQNSLIFITIKEMKNEIDHSLMGKQHKTRAKEICTKPLYFNLMAQDPSFVLRCAKSPHI